MYAYSDNDQQVVAMPTDEFSNSKSFYYSEKEQKIAGKKLAVFEAMYLYKSGDRFVMMCSSSYDQFELDASMIGPAARFLKEGLEGIIVHRSANLPTVVNFDEGLIRTFGGERIISVELPLIVELEIVSISEVSKEEGDTNDDGKLSAELETGATIFVPRKVKRRDKIRVDTKLGEYVDT